MNQREPTSAPIGAGQALPCLALLLLLLLAGAQGWAGSALSASPAFSAKPYLVALGSPPLRFEEPAPPPDLVTRPPASAPPEPALDAISDTSNNPTINLSAPATAPADIAATPATDLLPVSEITSGEVDSEPAVAIEDVSESPRTPPPILHDDLRPQTRPEDFLPFFQIPAPGSDASVIVPTPRTPHGTPLPPSSATYTQSPR